MTPEEELERFFSGFTQVDRDNVECWPEYKSAIKANDFTSAMEIASAIITSNLSIEQLKKLFPLKFPKYSD